MLKLYDIIPELSKEESRNVTLFLNRTNANNQRKDVALFDYIRKSKRQINEQDLLHKLYNSTEEKNSFYRLKNRLLGDINKSLSQLHYSKNDYNIVVNLLVLSKVFANKEKYDISYNYLIEAEKKALKNEFFDLLDLIYSDLIRLSQDSVAYNPIEYIDKRKSNHKVLYVLQEIDDMLAALMYRIKVSQNYSKTNLQFTELFQKTIDEFVNNEEIQKSPKLQFKIYHSISRILLQQRDYNSLESYLKLTFKDFVKRGLYNKSNHDTKLQMLTYLVNALFKNNKIEESLKVTNQLYEAMLEYDKLLYNKYLFYYYNSQVINYQVNNKPKAIEVLLEARTKEEIKNLSFYTVFVYLNLAILYFDTQDFKGAKTNLAKLKMSDSFGQMDEAFRLKVNIVELITFYELADIDLFDYQLNLIRKDFKVILDDKTYLRELMFIEIVSNIEKDSKTEFNNKVNKFVALPESNYSDENDIIDYNVWLKGLLK